MPTENMVRHYSKHLRGAPTMLIFLLLGPIAALIAGHAVSLAFSSAVGLPRVFSWAALLVSSYGITLTLIGTYFLGAPLAMVTSLIFLALLRVLSRISANAANHVVVLLVGALSGAVVVGLLLLVVSSLLGKSAGMYAGQITIGTALLISQGLLAGAVCGLASSVAGWTSK